MTILSTNLERTGTTEIAHVVSFPSKWAVTLISEPNTTPRTHMDITYQPLNSSLRVYSVANPLLKTIAHHLAMDQAAHFLTLFHCQCYSSLIESSLGDVPQVSPSSHSLYLTIQQAHF